MSLMTSSQIIDALGGTAEVARLCEVEMAAVSQWRHNGIPSARLMFLKLARPDLFAHEADSSREATRKSASKARRAGDRKSPRK